jgi:hypothetical protein
MFVATWLGFALLPDTHAMLRPPAAIGLAALVGVGSELALRRVAGSDGAFINTAWIIPAGAVLAMVGWFSTIPERPWFVGLLGAAFIVGLVYLQTVELSGPAFLQGPAHALNIGVGFALAFGAYVVAAPASPIVAMGLSLLASAAGALIVLRRGKRLDMPAILYAGVTALAVMQVAWILYGGRATPVTFGALLVLALYGTSGVGHAILDRAPARAYVEVIAVTVVSLGAIALVAARA